MAVIFTCCGRRNEASFPEAAMDSLFEAEFAAVGPAAVVAITKGDSMLYLKAFGLVDIENGIATTPDTRFNICSISKQFSAIALLKLQEQGLLSLDDRLCKFFPEFTSPALQDVTLRHMMSHTSGVPDIRPRTDAEWEAYTPAEAHERFANVTDYKLFSAEPDAIDMFTVVDSLAFEPGTAYEYQNPTFQLVYYIVERVTGVPFEQWMQENIFDPACMSSTTYFNPERTIANAAKGYEVGENGWQECDYGEAAFFGTAADGGLYTTAADFMNWQKALYGDRIVGASSRAQAHTPLIATDLPDTGYGLGFFIEDHPGRPRKIYHTGDNGGFYTYACAIPDAGVSYLIFAARQGWDRYALAASLDSLIQVHKVL